MTAPAKAAAVTSLPWSYTDHGDRRHKEFAIMSGVGKIASLYAGFGAHFDWAATEAHAALIVCAVNSHADMLAALRGLVRHVDDNTCIHENTHRGGAIWTICDECGRKWADDEGGFKPYEDAPELAAARAAITKAES